MYFHILCPQETFGKLLYYIIFEDNCVYISFKCIPRLVLESSELSQVIPSSFLVTMIIILCVCVYGIYVHTHTYMCMYYICISLYTHIIC